MLRSQIVLPGSLDLGPANNKCSKCGSMRQKNDGIYMGSKFVCGACWRLKAIRRKPGTKK